MIAFMWMFILLSAIDQIISQIKQIFRHPVELYLSYIVKSTRRLSFLSCRVYEVFFFQAYAA